MEAPETRWSRHSPFLKRNRAVRTACRGEKEPFVVPPPNATSSLSRIGSIGSGALRTGAGPDSFPASGPEESKGGECRDYLVTGEIAAGAVSESPERSIRFDRRYSVAPTTKTVPPQKTKHPRPIAPLGMSVSSNMKAP